MVESRRRLGRGGALALCLVGAVLGAMGLSQGAKRTARQTCADNLARVAQATLLYLADNDGRFPPHESAWGLYTCQWGADQANPWLRWPVVLDSYLADRAAYLCPGVETPPQGHSVATRPAWVASGPITGKTWPEGPCGSVWPPGWGGAVTDSAVQGACLDPNRFRATIGAAVGALGDATLARVEDPRHHLMWADASRLWVNLGSVIWASACRADCADRDGRADWENCAWSQGCGAGGDFAERASRRAGFTRHHGGSNIAFVDGHVAWLSVTQMIEAYQQGRLQGAAPAGATEGKPWYLRR